MIWDLIAKVPERPGLGVPSCTEIAKESRKERPKQRDGYAKAVRRLPLSAAFNETKNRI